MYQRKIDAADIAVSINVMQLQGILAFNFTDYNNDFNFSLSLLLKRSKGEYILLGIKKAILLL